MFHKDILAELDLHSFGLFRVFVGYCCISFLMTLSVSFLRDTGADVAGCGTPALVNRRMLSAVAESLGMRQEVLLRESRSLPAVTCSFKVFGFSDTEEVKHRNARLSHYI